MSLNIFTMSNYFRWTSICWSSSLPSWSKYLHVSKVFEVNFKILLLLSQLNKNLSPLASYTAFCQAMNLFMVRHSRPYQFHHLQCRTFLSILLQISASLLPRTRANTTSKITDDEVATTRDVDEEIIGGRQSYHNNSSAGNQWFSSDSHSCCQIFNGVNHIEPNCFQWYNHTINPLAYVTNQSHHIAPQIWYPDSGVSFHISPDLANLHSVEDYNGMDQVQVGNEQGLPIHHTSNSMLSLSLPNP